MDKELLKGCKNSVELIFRLIDHHGFVKDPWGIGTLQLAAYLAREKLEVGSNLELCERLIEDLYPEARRLFVKPKSDRSKPKTQLLWAAEVAMVEYTQRQSSKNLPVSLVAEYLHNEYDTPTRLGSKYSENVRDQAVRELANQFLQLMEDKGVDLEKFIDSYMKHKK